MLLWPPNRGRRKIFLAVTVSIPLAFLRVRTAEVDKLLLNEGIISFGGRYPVSDGFNWEKIEFVQPRTSYVRC
jgi:hypothetical protein